jgi:hypothetical protein
VGKDRLGRDTLDPDLVIAGLGDALEHLLGQGQRRELAAAESPP